MNLYRYTKEDLMILPKRDLLLEYKLVIKGLAQTKSHDKINWYIEYQKDIEEILMERMK